MKTNVICYVPVRNGTVLNEQAWGLMDMAKRINTDQLPLIGIVVHSGLESGQIAALPFDEVYHVRLEPGQWRVSEYHVEVFEKMQEEMGVTNGIYLFGDHPLYHEAAVRLSVRHRAGIITGALDILRAGTPGSSVTVKRGIYREKAHEFVTFRNPARPQFISMNPAMLYGKPREGRPSTVREIHSNHLVPGKVKFLSETVIHWEELKITEARCVIGIGRGVSGAGSIDDIIRLAGLLNAPIGGSKVADELGLIPRDKRIGSSGNVIDADIYVAIGISGSSQHLEGIKGVKHVIAVNQDPSAPIFQRCDIGIVGKFEEVIPQLVSSLQSESSVSGL